MICNVSWGFLAQTEDKWIVPRNTVEESMLLYRYFSNSAFVRGLNFMFTLALRAARCERNQLLRACTLFPVSHPADTEQYYHSFYSLGPLGKSIFNILPPFFSRVDVQFLRKWARTLLPLTVNNSDCQSACRSGIWKWTLRSCRHWAGWKAEVKT